MTTPTQPTMTDDRLDRMVRQLLAERAEDVAADAVSADAMAERIASRLRPTPVARAWVLAAAAILVTLLIGGAVVVGGAVRLPWVPLPAIPTSTPTPVPNAAPWLQLPPPPAHEGVDALGWPDTNENRAGLYSWNGSCASAFCSIGFMHNGYGTGDVEISIEALRERPAPGDGTAVTVAGHDAIYRRIDALHEEWIVFIEARTIAIRLAVRPSTSQATLNEAYSIIGSMRTEPQPGSPPFRLVFTLTTDDWDSG